MATNRIAPPNAVVARMTRVSSTRFAPGAAYRAIEEPQLGRR